MARPGDGVCDIFHSGSSRTRDVRLWQILLQKSAILVVGLPLRPLEGRTLIIRSPSGRWWAFDRLRSARLCCWRRSNNQLCKAAEVLRDGAERELILCAARAAQSEPAKS